MIAQITQTRWERHRDRFIRRLREIRDKHEQENEKVSLDIEEVHIAVAGENDVESVPIEPAFLLVYAAERNGQIICIQSLGYSQQVFAAEKQFMKVCRIERLLDGKKTLIG